MVDDRRAAVLHAVVQHYIETSQPVSSSSVQDRKGINASSATVRSEMAALERDGYLQQPHTSAGRIPTDTGYRFFVDNLSESGKLTQTQQQSVHEFFDRASGEIEQMMHETGRLLSDLTGAASVVVAPDHDRATVRSAQLVPLADNIVLAVLVLSDGTVEKCSLEQPENTTAEDVAFASTRLAQLLNGTRFDALSGVKLQEGDLAKRAIEALHASHVNEDQVIVGGTSLLASSFGAVEIVRSVLTILEEQFVVVTLMRDLLDRGVTVSIGNENKMQPLAQCSLVVAPTVVDGEQRGSVAVLGPTRMDYSQAISAVAIVSRTLGERLGSK